MSATSAAATATVTGTVTNTTNSASLPSILNKPFPTRSVSFRSSRDRLKNLTPLRYSVSASNQSPAASTPIIKSVSVDQTKPSLKSRLHGGETLYGIFLLSFSPTLAEIVAFAGYDYVVIDMEHGPGGVMEALSCIRAVEASGAAAILRLPESSAAWAKKALDLGPQGIMFPMIESPKDAKKAVSYCRFPPDGIRGSAHTVARASNYGINEGYLGSYAEELLIMCQVESEEAVKKISEITTIDGVDCVQMGPLDLSASMGYLWDPGHKKVREMMRKAEKAVLGSDPANGGAYLGGFAMPHDGPDELRTRGYHMVSGTVDVGLFRSAAVEDVRRFKTGMMKRLGDEDESEQKDMDDEKYWSE